MRFTSVSDVLGNITGMNRSDPSLSGGMNSLPNPRTALATECHCHCSSFAIADRGKPIAMANATDNSSTARVRTVLRWRSDQSRMGS
ncbi:MAG: hypothetical protein JW388_0441 [Nitrospira sp.]|nr:hypothetical protein [Nitrospira sp.]